ncbi:phosphosulfolactate synthase [Alkalihalobacillus sp. LMS39]|uniref:phosphosulfolactate synthase n=1 Tax=Alkalihalobacillus sp. LMS39 TaxID=2924032 RepID=UPI001FB1C21C|nr:phosphosulfolactate synthase [Alkalihalobacillus sp. LMS39]UOE92536.1 phosphosulfolactate synthase [Alkalihalobacillus sp. LMS39]
MSNLELSLPIRQQKPRQHGISIIIDNGVPISFFRDMMKSSSELIDFVKFGWGTSLVTKHIEEKIACLQDHDVDYFFGGTLFEKSVSQNKVEQYFHYCQNMQCKYIEISNGTVPISNKEKAEYIKDFSKDFFVFSEVGSKDCTISNEHHSKDWIEFIHEDIEAGAMKVITEARESGTSGLCQENGEIRLQIVEDIVSSGLNLQQIIFEAPSKEMQTCFIEKIGPNVNLANISIHDTIALETLRLGLRSDTFHLFTNKMVVTLNERN